MADVTLKLTMGSFTVEVTGPQDYAEKKLQELVNQYLTGPSKAPSADTPLPATQGTGKKMSAAEFLKKVPNHNAQDRALILGYFLEKYEQASSFTTSEIGQLGRQAKYPFPNVSDSISRLVARGLMMSAGDKDGARAYSLTASGEALIESAVESEKT